MIRTILIMLAVLSVSTFQSAQAALITVKLPNNSVNYTTTVDSQFDANIYIEDTPDLGGFDLSLIYNNNKFSVQSFTSGTIFGAANTETLANTQSPGTIRLSEAISGTSPLTEGLNIDAPTLIGTVSFKALSTVAFSPIDILVNANTPIVSTFDGDSVALSKQNAFVSVNPVPEPEDWAMMMIGLPLISWVARRKQALSKAT